MTQTAAKRGIDWTLVGTLGVLFFGYILLFDITGGQAGSSLFAVNWYDSYSLQARAWLEGRTSVDPFYSEWLELAVYNGEYFVSFPPFPSILMLPFVLLFGENVPSNFVLVLTTLACVAFSYECFRRRGTKEKWAAFWAVFYVMGSNMLSMSAFGGVWYMAQGFNLAFTTAALWALLCHRRGLCLALLACAVGCRPFSICLFFGAWLYFVMRIRAGQGKQARQKVWEALRILIIPALIAGFYMYYNYIRFDNVLEFGHTYLPEFQEAELGQFDARYIAQNVYNIFCIPVSFAPDSSLLYPQFDGFMFFLANPFFLVWFVYLIRDILRRTFGKKQLLITVCFIISLLLLLSHKTFGGWQFGARYTVDLLPCALAYLIADGVERPNEAVVFTGIAAVLFNAYGALALFYIF